MFQSDALPIPNQVSDHGPTAQLVFIVLHEATRGLTTDEIASAIARPAHTVRRVACELADDGLIDRRPDPQDGRRRIYDLP